MSAVSLVEWQADRSCARKNRYHSAEFALTVAQRSIDLGRADELATYSCFWCRGWHLTKQTDKACPDHVAARHTTFY